LLFKIKLSEAFPDYIIRHPSEAYTDEFPFHEQLHEEKYLRIYEAHPIEPFDSNQKRKVTFKNDKMNFNVHAHVPGTGSQGDPDEDLHSSYYYIYQMVPSVPLTVRSSPANQAKIFHSTIIKRLHIKITAISLHHHNDVLPMTSMGACQWGTIIGEDSLSLLEATNQLLSYQTISLNAIHQALNVLKTDINMKKLKQQIFGLHGDDFESVQTETLLFQQIFTILTNMIVDRSSNCIGLHNAALIVSIVSHGYDVDDE
jgi:hypothetical protein